MYLEYDGLTLTQKVEVFEYALENTAGQDLAKVLWLKSQNSEVWLDRRTNYTRSLAAMSMVGYILGLGDRHPSNLMLDRITGKIIHIDFGDCFEVAMQREKYPEKIPFRLTRMLVNAMEVSGIEGNFRFTCENVMRVMRESKDSVMAMLEAFVHDPLINWRLLTPNKASPVRSPAASDASSGSESESVPSHSMEAMSQRMHSIRHSSLVDYSTLEVEDSDYLASSAFGQRVDRERELVQALGPEGSAAPSEMINAKAVSVINRVSNKLTGKDFGDSVLTVKDQVQRLIRQATSNENLCQCYVGWCPFW